MNFKCFSQSFWMFQISILLVFGCGQKTPTKLLSSFKVAVADQNGSPIPGVRIEGGVDWDCFSAVTNEKGEGWLPYKALNQKATLSKTNCFPAQVTLFAGSNYRMTVAPKQVREIGQANGKLIKYDLPFFAMISYSGTYQVVSVSGSGIKTVADFPMPATYKKIVLHGDSLWFTTHQDGIYAYSLANLQQPQFIRRLYVPGYLGAFDIKDSLLAVGGYDSLRIYRMHSDGSLTKCFHFDVLYVVDAKFIKDYLVITNYSDCLPCIFDVHSPDSIRLISQTPRSSGYWRALWWGDSLVLGDDLGNHQIIDLSEPAIPKGVGTFQTEARIEFIGRDWAVGSNLNDWSSTTILSLNVGSNTPVTPQAIISGVFTDELGFGGAFPPYYIVGGKVWKLQ